MWCVALMFFIIPVISAVNRTLLDWAKPISDEYVTKRASFGQSCRYKPSVYVWGRTVENVAGIFHVISLSGANFFYLLAFQSAIFYCNSLLCCVFQSWQSLSGIKVQSSITVVSLIEKPLYKWTQELELYKLYKFLFYHITW